VVDVALTLAPLATFASVAFVGGALGAELDEPEATDGG
jgi:hypothetical protein